MLGRRRKLWAHIAPAIDQRLVFVAYIFCVLNVSLVLTLGTSRHSGTNTDTTKSWKQTHTVNNDSVMFWL